MNEDLLAEKEHLKKILDEKKALYDKVREEEAEKLEIRAIKNAIAIKTNQIKGRSSNEWEMRGKSFANFVIKNPILCLFLFGAFVMFLQQEWFAGVGSLVMALVIPEYMKMQKRKLDEKRANESKQ
jgi:hypothetical protein